MHPMADGSTWTADELLAMSPQERLEAIKADMITDLNQMPPEMLAKARADIRAHIAETGSTPPTDQ